MHSGRWLAGALLFAAGIGVGWMLATSSSAPSTPPERREPVVAREGNAARATPRAEDPAALLRDALSKIPQEPPPSGSEVVRGAARVAGAGTASGVRVVLEPEPAARAENARQDVADAAIAHALAERRRAQGRRTADVADDGTFSFDGLVAGDYRVRTLDAATGKELAPARTVTVVAGVPHDGVTIDVDRSSGITGRVLFPPGPDEIVYVKARPVPQGGGEFDVGAWLLDASSRSAVAKASEGGRFALDGLAPGRYVVGVDGAGPGIAVHETIDVGSGKSEVVFSLPPRAREDYVVLRVLDPAGDVVKDVTVVPLAFSVSGAASIGWFEGSLRADGTRLVPHPSVGDTPEKSDRRFLQVRSAAYGAIRASYDLGSEPAATMQFKSPAHVTVTVADIASSRYAAEVSVLLDQPWTEIKWYRHGDYPRGRVPKDGAVRLGPAQPGEYRIRVVVGPSGREHEVASSTVTLTEGENRAGVTLPRLEQVRVHGAKGELELRGVRDSAWKRKSAADADGVASFDAVPAGEYEVRAEGREPVRVTVPDVLDVRLD